MSRPRLHLIAMPHTQTTSDYPSCAYTQKVVKFCRMMMRRDWEVILYSGEHNEAPCTEHVQLVSEEERAGWFGKGFDTVLTPLSWSPAQPYWLTMNARAIQALSERVAERDLILLTTGTQKLILDAFPLPHRICCEWTVGYMGIESDFCAFESSSFMHTCYERNGIENGRDFDAVIPNFFDPLEFPYTNQGGGEYLLYVGRLIARKGIEQAEQVAKAAGMRFLVAGPGAVSFSKGRIEAVEFTIVGDHIEYVGEVGIAERAELMAGAYAVLSPTKYLEPFGGSAVEAQMCGTPAITTDFGAYRETVAPEFRFRTLAQALAAVKAAGEVDHVELRRSANERFSLDAVAPMYERWFDQLELAVGSRLVRTARRKCMRESRHDRPRPARRDHGGARRRLRLRTGRHHHGHDRRRRGQQHRRADHGQHRRARVLGRQRSHLPLPGRVPARPRRQPLCHLLGGREPRGHGRGGLRGDRGLNRGTGDRTYRRPVLGMDHGRRRGRLLRSVPGRHQRQLARAVGGARRGGAVRALHTVASRACAARSPCGPAPTAAAAVACRRWRYSNGTYGYVPTWGGDGWLMPNGRTSCHCTCVPEVELGRYDVQGIAQVKIDGEVIAPSAYRLDNRWKLVRMDGLNWPSCRNIAAEDDEAGTFAVSYWYGEEPSELATSAAASLACQLYAACNNSGRCKLPERTRQVARAGLVIEIGSLIAESLKAGATGILAIDTFIATYGGGGGGASVWSPDLAPAPRKVG